MSVEWKIAPPEVIEIAQELIGQYHEPLLEADIGFLFRSEAPRSGGGITLGMAKKVPADAKVLMKVPYDFIIWLAEDWWYRLEPAQRTALIDHELCHCALDEEGKPSLARHDVEEFNVILARHGFWWPGAEATTQSLSQMALPIGEIRRRGRVEAVDPSDVGFGLN